MRLFSVLAVLALFSQLGPIAADEKQALTFTQDGKDVVVTTEITVFEGPYALGTTPNAGPGGGKATLAVCVVQNMDLIKPKVKTIKVEWRLPDTKLSDTKKKGVEFSVQVVRFNGSTEELKPLQIQLGKLVEQGEKKKSTAPKE